mgnify:CR=1 FL=1
MTVLVWRDATESREGCWAPQWLRLDLPLDEATLNAGLRLLSTSRSFRGTNYRPVLKAWADTFVCAVDTWEASLVQARVARAGRRMVMDWRTGGGRLAFAAVKRAERGGPVLGVMSGPEVRTTPPEMAQAMMAHWAEVYQGGAP